MEWPTILVSFSFLLFVFLFFFMVFQQDNIEETNSLKICVDVCKYTWMFRLCLLRDCFCGFDLRKSFYIYSKRVLNCVFAYCGA